ncbi:Bug family tripartite tricarboxylate transporter substrate binding protein [Achromobacter mucicolens]|uniref:Bug family tripartite tricarboxylate transporter substrate binding protein n=1 Tax=Achromobacter mucicolens TaxID=1389922 RepID=UPI0022F3A375|nr:tripartite tricarboxylate transporter substrate binding protein [Achromobacter mucicolens]WBX87548.1 tripartite tricarboxylate transporter substrate binding protein [Achromobacter mucicolens]
MNSLLRLVILCVGALCAFQAGAAGNPAGPLRLVVGFPPGGGTDGAARIIAEKLPALLNQPTIVENRGGAGGTLGALNVARAAPDGNALFFGTSAELIINPVTRKTAPYNVLEQFTPIGEVGSVSFVLVVPASSPITSVQSLITRAKGQPDRLNFSSFGIGSTNHMIGELFLSRTGIRATHIPYQGSAPAMSALLANEVDFTFETSAVALPHIKAGKLRALATPSPARLRDLPDTPTLQELGFQNLAAEGWMGVFAPANMAPDLVQRFNAALNAVLDMPDVREKLTARGVDVSPGSARQFHDMLATEQQKWRRVAQESGISLD